MPPSAAAATAAKKNLVEVTVPMPADSGATTGQQALEVAQRFQIVSAADYERAAAAAAIAGARWDAVDGERQKLKAPSLEACRRTDAFFAPALSALKSAKNIFREKMAAWDREQEELRNEQQRKLDEAARIERERLQREAAEAQRRANETAAQQRKEAEAARQAGDLTGAQKLEQRAARTEERAAAKVETLEATAMSVVAPVVQTVAPKISGVARKRVWKFKITDDAKIPREYLKIDEQAIAGVVRALKGNTNIPGVQVWDEPDVAVSKGAV